MPLQDMLVGTLASVVAAAVRAIASDQADRVGGMLAVLVPFMLAAYVSAAIRAALQGEQPKPSSRERL